MNLAFFVKTCTNIRSGHPLSKPSSIISRVSERHFKKCGKQENLSALEYHKGEWQIYYYRDDVYAPAYAAASKQVESPSHKDTFEELLKEFELR
jgi:hypothetical protein